MNKEKCMSGQNFQHMLMRRTKDHIFNTITSYHDGIAIVDEAGIIVFVNPACEQIFGRKAAFLVGEPFGFPLDTGNMAEIKVDSGSEVHTVDITVSETKWMGRPAYMVLMRDIASHENKLIELRRFKRALDGTLEMIALLDPLTFTILYVNQGCINTLGYSRKEMLGKKPYGFFMRSEEYIHEVLSPLIDGNKKIGFFETVLKAKDGRRIEVELVAQIVQQEEDSPVMIIIARDITERRNVQAEIAKLYQAVEQSPCSVVITDVKGNIEYANPKFQSVTGYSLHEVLGKNPRILKSGEQTPDFYRQLWQTITTGDEWRGELHNKRKNGELFWELAVISPVRNHNGEITNFIAVKEDITKRKLAEAELMRTHAVLSQIFEATGDGLVVIDKDYNIIQANTALYSLFCVEKEAVSRKKCYDILKNSACKTAKCPLQQIMSGKTRVEEDTEKLWSDGRLNSYIVTATPFCDHDGKTIGIVGNIKDVTERKKEQDRITKEMKLAAKLQREFLPNNLEETQFKLKSIYYPYHHVSGDGFEFLYDANRHILIGLLFDVMGHGFSAALQNSAIRVMFKQIETKRITLAKKMAWLNRHAAAFLGDSFAAAIGFEINFKKQELVYCAAGISYFYHLHGGKMRLVKAPGTFLGITKDTTFEQHTLRFGHGESFYFLSDGLTDLMRSKEISASNFDEVYALLVNFARSKLCRDDATALCVGIN